MNTVTPRSQRIFLVLAPICAGLAAGLAAYGLANEPNSTFDWSVAAVSELVYDSAAVLSLEGKEGITHPAFVAARFLAVAFAFFAAVGLVLELYRPASDLWLAFRFTLARLRGKRAAVLFGLGWIGGPLAAQLRGAGRPVYGIAKDEASPRVDEARRSSALVIIGDATDRATRARTGIKHASEAFIATGDDARNVEIAGDLLLQAHEGKLGWRSRRNPLRCYVHVGDPAFSETLSRHDLWAPRTAPIELHPFSNQELAVRDLYFREQDGLVVDSAALPQSDEVFHLFIFGFGSMGRTVALHLARFGHFASGLRPRLSVYGDFDREGNGADKDAFLDRYPAFSPADLDLTSATFRSAGDAWSARPGRPVAERFQREARVQAPAGSDEVLGELRPVEYAVNAEYRPLPVDVESGRFLAELVARLRPSGGPAVRAAAVLCFEEERRSFQAALRLQQALARQMLDDEATQGEPPSQPILPLHVYLPVEEGLAALIKDPGRHRPRSDGDRTAMHTERCFPLRVFGERDAVSSYRQITRTPTRRRAGLLRAAHRLLSSGSSTDHADFAASNMDAALHADVKLTALSVSLRDSPLPATDARARGLREQPLMDALFTPDVDKAFHRMTRRGQVAGSVFAQLEDPALRERLALMEQVEASTPAEHEDVRSAMEGAIARFRAELAEVGRDADLAARMEHGRWMGERLSRGWSFGPRSDLRRHRMTFVPWDNLSEAQRHYDRAHLPRLVVQHREAGRYAYVAEAQPDPAEAGTEIAFPAVGASSPPT